jgi:hypothetical protein
LSPSRLTRLRTRDDGWFQEDLGRFTQGVEEVMEMLGIDHRVW